MRKENNNNLILVPGSTSTSEQAALPTLRPDQRCLSFNMGRASDIEGGLLTIRNVNGKLDCSHFKMVLHRVEQMECGGVRVLVLMSRDLDTCTVAYQLHTADCVANLKVVKQQQTVIYG